MSHKLVHAVYLKIIDKHTGYTLQEIPMTLPVEEFGVIDTPEKFLTAFQKDVEAGLVCDNIIKFVQWLYREANTSPDKYVLRVVNKELTLLELCSIGSIVVLDRTEGFEQLYGTVYAKEKEYVVVRINKWKFIRIYHDGDNLYTMAFSFNPLHAQGIDGVLTATINGENNTKFTFVFHEERQEWYYWKQESDGDCN